MSRIDTLTQFLTEAGTRFEIYDLGRQLRPLPLEQFQRIEQQHEPYPWPLQQKAWLAVHFHQSEGKHFLWFLRFALDEQGLLMSAGPKQFMELVVETLGYQLTGELDESKADKLASNPWTFRPAEAKMASLHARLARQLGQEPSAFFAPLCHYLTQPATLPWQQLGVQGFSDLAERIDDPTLLALVCKSLPTLPEPVLCALCQALEAVPLPPALQGALLERLGREQERTEANNETIAHLCRAHASCGPQPLRRAKLLTLLQTRPDPALLLAIAGRLAGDLDDEGLLDTYLETLAQTDISLFASLFGELVMQPRLRAPLLGKLRDPNRSAALSQAIGHLFKAAQA
ncbi:Protein of unknown function [Aeromonas sp. RU39B]|uniref:DUF3549 family protein n=1 Tax=Aeromonas sp. RU39B TaxID=1907416 RepID=UPI0009548DB5|nr:DUF3549 family protein [Aeromonas sp. RU39B]SIP89947.1 Protein of unknown function [Aeromonas sp. RU39B]